MDQIRVDDDYDTQNINAILQHTGSDVCYFGECTKRLCYTINYVNSYNEIEIDSMYRRFLEYHNLVINDYDSLTKSAIDHLAHHFVEFLIEFKQTCLSRHFICLRILYKSIGNTKHFLSHMI